MIIINNFPHITAGSSKTKQTDKVLALKLNKAEEHGKIKLDLLTYS